MADSGGAGQVVDDVAAGEGVADEAEPAFRMKACAVEGDDARGLLAAMLQGVEPEGGDGGGVGMAENAKYAALFTKAIRVEVQRIAL